jgi:hypothetical protein
MDGADDNLWDVGIRRLGPEQRRSVDRPSQSWMGLRVEQRHAD